MTRRTLSDKNIGSYKTCRDLQNRRSYKICRNPLKSLESPWDNDTLRNVLIQQVSDDLTRLHTVSCALTSGTWTDGDDRGIAEVTVKVDLPYIWVLFVSCFWSLSIAGTPVYWYWPLPTFRGSRPRLDDPPSFLSGCQSLQDIWQWCMSFEFLFITQEGPNGPVPPHSVQNTDNKWMMGQQRLIPIPIIQEGSNRGLIMTDPRYEVQFKFLVFLLSTAQFNHELSLSVLQ